MQAYDRVHRVGQTREVRVVRFMMTDSIEERMVAVQEAKQALGKGSLEKMSKADQEKAKLTTLKDLFQISEEEADNNWDWIGDDLVEDDDVEEDDEEWRG
jgi:SNF2 family DNA or RNA helicase